ncbi:DUF72 domain-containing protein [Agromyces archimandritae]|uniref:DUF72 domain-containing protein n=1 Tax=Agromyces archimandritae TaxID=2781962 RepID=A0A975FKT0_9MICO|nr:DUF72 domain-containing protein [Agromyces archimandritae]QTX03909.1 DUF72 domain-containing protein [Agromyces archimandritae]
MAAERSGVARVGVSGWVYPGWRGDFYPKGLKQADELAYISERLTSIEINGSFYRTQRPESWVKWRDTVPGDFVFSVKGPRYLTHVRRLEEPEGPVANFFASGVLTLGDELGAVLWQLPPSFDFEPVVLERFLAALPHTRDAASTAAAGHDEWMQGRTAFDIDADGPLRHAVEVRHPSFETEEWTELLARHDVAAVAADTAGKWPKIDAVTADFVYARLHGDQKLYASGYDEAGLDRWEAWARDHLEAGRDAYVYFDNDAKVRAPFDAMALIERLAS